AGRARLGRALVLEIDDAVLVVVGLGAAVGVLESVRIFRIVHARLAGRVLVGDVGDRVEIVVRIGAAVVVEVAVLVFRREDALVLRVGDPVAVGVGIVGAAVFVLVALVVLGLVRALV